MMNMLASFVAGEGKTKDRYTLDQVLTIVVLRSRKATVEDIAKIVGHPKNSVNYKMLWIGKKVKQFGDEAINELYKVFKEEAPADVQADVDARVEKFVEAAS